MLCGVNPMTEWLSQFKSLPEDTVATRTGTAEVDLQVEVAACVMGELAGELCVLDSNELRTYCSVQLCILLRLLAGMYVRTESMH